MQAQRERARAARKKTIVRALDLKTDAHTEFLGFDNNDCEAVILEVHAQDGEVLVVTNRTVLLLRWEDRKAIKEPLSYAAKAIQLLAYKKSDMRPLI